MIVRKPASLVEFFKVEAARSAGLGILLALVFGLLFTGYFAKKSMEDKVKTMALVASRAFYSPIVETQVYRDAEMQMREALKLTPGEAALVLKGNLELFYPISDESPSIGCQPEKICWGKTFKDVTYIQPLSYDDGRFFGYLELRLKTSVDWELLILVFSSIIFIFAIQALGLISRLGIVSRTIGERLNLWTKELKKLGTGVQSGPVPYVELQGVQSEVDGLRTRITALETRAAEEAKSAAQLSIIRQMEHDLKTPISQLSKYWFISQRRDTYDQVLQPKV